MVAAAAIPLGKIGWSLMAAYLAGKIPEGINSYRQGKSTEKIKGMEIEAAMGGAKAQADAMKMAYEAMAKQAEDDFARMQGMRTEDRQYARENMILQNVISQPEREMAMMAMAMQGMGGMGNIRMPERSPQPMPMHMSLSL